MFTISLECFILSLSASIWDLWSNGSSTAAGIGADAVQRASGHGLAHSIARLSRVIIQNIDGNGRARIRCMSIGMVVSGSGSTDGAVRVDAVTEWLRRSRIRKARLVDRRQSRRASS